VAKRVEAPWRRSPNRARHLRHRGRDAGGASFRSDVARQRREFFKNPVVSREKHGELIARFPSLVGYALPAGVTSSLPDG